MSTTPLETLFRDLATEEDVAQGGHFVALPVPGHEPHRLARSSSGEPALLLTVDGLGGAVRRLPAIELEHLTIRQDVECTIRGPGQANITARVTVIEFTGGNRRLRELFLHVTASLLASIGSSTDAGAVGSVVQSIVELFRPLARPSTRSVQGVWAELFLIASSVDPALLVRSWRLSPDSRFDFGWGVERIEVKSAAGRVRKHRFSMEQLLPPAECTLLIASVLMERTSGGTSLSDLYTHAVSRIPDPDLQVRLYSVLATTLGEAMATALEMRFDRELASSSLKLFDHAAIPRILEEPPAGVSEISFVADLTGITEASISSAAGPLFRALATQG